MKIFACILYLYLVAIIVIPCIDKAKDDTIQHIELAQGNADHSHEMPDLCSPFCTCICCASPIISRGNVQYFYHLIPQDRVTPFVSAYHASPVTTIWQPPKIS